MAKSLAEIEAAFAARCKQQEAEAAKTSGEQSQEELLVKKLAEADVQHPKKAAKATVISDLLFYFALVAMVVCAVLFSRGAMGEQTFGGYRFYEVLSTSMEGVYPRGSLVLIKETDPYDLAVGDDITFAWDSANLITHRIVEINEDYEGQGSRGFVTKGVDNAAADPEVVPAGQVLGKVVKGIPRLGAAFSWLGGNLWLLLLLFLSVIGLSFFLKLFFRENRKGKDQRIKRKRQQSVAGKKE